ncbi:MAG: hypothetical protein IID05_06000 [Gemmatimonadetes bacterium]|nr:hypothetical protein [Gemmatimonadota bacterium]
MANWTAAGHRVDVIGDTTVGAEDAVDRLRRGGTECVLLQYVPFLYGRRGVSSYPERFARACAARGMRLTIFVHEPWVPPTRIPWIPLGWLQRRQLRRLLRLAPKAVTTVPTWQAMLGAHVRLIYVGCTLGPPGGGDHPPRRPHSVLPSSSHHLPRGFAGTGSRRRVVRWTRIRR